MMRHQQSALVAVAALGLSLAGCSVGEVPSQANPTCSWGNQVPANSSQVCNEVFTTLQRLARAGNKDQRAIVARFVANPQIAKRILHFGAKLRTEGSAGVHVVPSVTLQREGPLSFGAGFYLLGKSDKGLVSNPQTVYLRIRDGKAIVVRDQPGQDW